MWKGLKKTNAAASWRKVIRSKADKSSTRRKNENDSGIESKIKESNIPLPYLPLWSSQSRHVLLQPFRRTKISFLRMRSRNMAARRTTVIVCCTQVENQKNKLLLSGCTTIAISKELRDFFFPFYLRTIVRAVPWWQRFIGSEGRFDLAYCGSEIVSRD